MPKAHAIITNEPLIAECNEADGPKLEMRAVVCSNDDFANFVILQ